MSQTRMGEPLRQTSRFVAVRQSRSAICGCRGAGDPSAGNRKAQLGPTLNLEDLLARQIVTSLPLDKFEVAYSDDVGDPSDEICQQVFIASLPRKGSCTFFVMRGGITVVEDAKGRWSAFESRERVEDREYYSRWSSFIRGTWVRRTPAVAGIYPTRDLEGRRSRDRELRLVNGKLRDVTAGGGFQSPAQVSSWRGDWWSAPFPPLRGAL